MAMKSFSPQQMFTDIAAAFGASFCVAPFITMVDQSIMENASGKRSIGASLTASMKELVMTPHKFLTKPAFFLLWGVYGGTYTAANLITSTCDIKEASSQQRATAKFVGVSAANLSLNITKDSIFTRWFGSGVPRPIPMTTYLNFSARDSLTVFASFNLSPIAAAYMVDNEMCDKGTAVIAAQLACPVAMQWLSAPLHLYGLDAYNSGPQPFGARVDAIKKNYLQTALARSARIGPAFGVGALLNTPLRAKLGSALVKD